MAESKAIQPNIKDLQDQLKKISQELRDATSTKQQTSSRQWSEWTTAAGFTLQRSEPHNKRAPVLCYFCKTNEHFTVLKKRDRHCGGHPLPPFKWPVTVSEGRGLADENTNLLTDSEDTPPPQKKPKNFGNWYYFPFFQTEDYHIRLSFDFIQTKVAITSQIYFKNYALFYILRKQKQLETQSASEWS